jgi:hypothetical protein
VLALVRPGSAKESQFKNLQVTIHVVEANFPQPVALGFDQGEQVGRFVRPGVIVALDLFPRLPGTVVLMVGVQGVYKMSIKDTFTPDGARGDVFQVEENATWFE